MLHPESRREEVEELFEKAYETSHFEFLSDRLRSTLSSTSETLWCETWTFESSFRTFLHYDTDEATFLSMASFMRFT